MNEDKQKQFIEKHAEGFTSFLGQYMASKLIFGWIFKWMINIGVIYFTWKYVIAPMIK